MNESEAHVMRLTEQAKILKEEIRRLERNVIREKETQNMEYLKNILMKVSIYEHLWPVADCAVFNSLFFCYRDNSIHLHECSPF